MTSSPDEPGAPRTIRPDRPSGRPRRVSVIGTSGSGKTTIARKLAAVMGVRHIELDALHWGPDWTPRPQAQIRASLDAAIVDAAGGWVIDGNYSFIRPHVWAMADTVVWLDYPMGTVSRQVFLRTIRRVITRDRLWSGNIETWQAQFTRSDSILVWVWQTWRKRRREYPKLLKRPENAHLRVYRCRTPADADRLLAMLNLAAPGRRNR